MEEVLEELEEEVKYDCNVCQDTGVVEIMGGTDYDEWTVVGHVPCSCMEE